MDLDLVAHLCEMTTKCYKNSGFSGLIKYLLFRREISEKIFKKKIVGSKLNSEKHARKNFEKKIRQAGGWKWAAESRMATKEIIDHGKQRVHENLQGKLCQNLHWHSPYRVYRVSLQGWVIIEIFSDTHKTRTPLWWRRWQWARPRVAPRSSPGTFLWRYSALPSTSPGPCYWWR